jgi:Putative adhesin
MSAESLRARFSSGRARRSAALTTAVTMAVTVAVAALGLVASGCGILFAGPASSDQQSQTYHHAISRIQFNLDSGDITLSPGAAGTVTVRRRLQWDQAKPDVTQAWSGDTLRITATCPSEPRCSVDYTVQVPASVAVRTHSGAGDVTVRGLTGGVDVSDSTGDIHLIGVGGQVRVDSNTGTITGTRLQSTDAIVRGVTGDVALGFSAVPDTVSATTQTGQVLVTVPQRGAAGYQVQADTTTGQRTVRVAVDSGSPRSIMAKTTDGDVTVN